jgi:hypothetical protein
MQPTQHEEEICGLRVRYGRMDEQRRRDAAIKVSAALQLLQRFAPRRLVRLRNQHVELLVVTGQGTSSYSAGANVIVLDVSQLSQLTGPGAACVIVHEGTHARFAHADIPYSRKIAARVERRCVEEEIAFVNGLPHTSEAEHEAWVARKRERLARAWWTHGERVRALAASLKQEGAPAWFVRFILLFAGPGVS